MRYPTIEHHGASEGMTGSCYQLQMDASSSLLVDCGLFQGGEISADGRASAGQLAIEFTLQTVKALVVTHVHIDHVGRIPHLLAAGFKGPILCSEPSARLLPIVLEDVFKLSFSRDYKEIVRYIERVEQRLLPLPYNQWYTPAETVTLVARVRLQRTELQPYWNQKAREQVAVGRDSLAFDNLITIDSHADHIAVVNNLTQAARPVIVIAGGGMCGGGGRIVTISRPCSATRATEVLFVGHQAQGRSFSNATRRAATMNWMASAMTYEPASPASVATRPLRISKGWWSL